MKYYTYQVLNQSNNKRYFGFTNNPQKRWKQHLMCSKNSKKDCPYLHNALSKGSLNDFVFSIISEHNNKQEALQKEVSLIELYNTQNPIFGYNITCGGEPGGFVNETHRQKCVLRMKINNPMKTLRTNKGTFKKGHSPVITEERNNKISESKKGKKNPMYGNKNAANHLNKIQYDCAYCGKKCNLGNLKRWHMDNCVAMKKSNR